MARRSKTLEEQLSSMMPALTGSDADLVENLPSEYALEVPHFYQDEQHWCGAACVQMLQAYHGDEVLSQAQIASLAGWRDWRRLNHESFAEDLDRLLARLNFLPARYYPGAYILREFSTGVEGGDFIMANRERVSEIDFRFFKAMILAAGGPALCRIHFSTDEYPMDEPLAERLDNAGHCLVMTGWSKRGFLFNDPWNYERWGGRRAGTRVEISYEDLTNVRPLVNCCKDSVEPDTKLRMRLEEPRRALIHGRDVELRAIVEWPGVGGLLARSYALTDVSARLFVPEGFTVRGPEIQKAERELRPGSSLGFSWPINLGEKIGSKAVFAEVLGSLTIPAFPWEQHRKQETHTIRATSSIRLDVKSEVWFNSYGRF
jgi:hypothetical protein